MDISIIGSCQSRDIFNTKFIKEYKKYFRISSYFSMTSMISIMGNSIRYHFSNLVKTDFKDCLMEHWYQELEKNALKTLESKQPNVLLLDFYADARYGAIAYGDSYIINRTGRLKNLGVLNWDKFGKAYSYNENTEEFIILWKQAFDKFMIFMKEKLPYTTIIINTVKGTKVVTDDMGETYLSPKIEDLDVEQINNLWKLFDDYAINNYGLEALRYNKEYTLDPGYPFSGLGYALVHFHKDYYRDCFEGLKQLTVNVNERSKQDVNTNLVIDSEYKKKLKNWTHKSGKFEIIDYSDYSAVRALDCRERLGDYRPQMWSKPIEISEDGETDYTLSFYVNIKDLSLLENDEVIFGIRTFKYMKEVKMKNAVEEYRLTIKDHDIRPGEDYRYVFTFTSKGKYVRLAPFMFHYVQGIEYSRIKLERASDASEYSAR